MVKKLFLAVVLHAGAFHDEDHGFGHVGGQVPRCAPGDARR